MNQHARTSAPSYPSRRSIAKGAAWAVPTVVATTAAPAFAASGACEPTIALYGGASYDWGYVPGSGTTTQSFNSTFSVAVNNLPKDAEITQLHIDMTLQNRDDSVNDGRYPGIFDPGNRHVTNRPSGFTCSTSYSTITGCDFSEIYNDARLGDPYQPSRYASGTRAMLYNGGGQTTGDMWNPDEGSASVTLRSNWTNFTFPGTSTTEESWTVRYSADPAIATSLLAPTADGSCVTLSNTVSKDTPTLNIVYGNVNVLGDDSLETQWPGWFQLTVVYTSGGRSYTLSGGRRAS